MEIVCPPKEIKGGEMEIRSEIYCHECDKYIQFTLDDELNGNHIVECPNCGHEHCRVIKDGKVTGDRWSSRNGQTFYATSVSYTSTSSELTYAKNSTQGWAGGSNMYSQWASNSYYSSGTTIAS